MKRLRKFLDLPPAERGLLVKAAILLWAIMLGLWLLPFQTFRRLLARVTQAPTGWREANQLSPDRIVWAVAVASRHMPGARTCLAQALAAQVLLARRGHPVRLRIGVAKGEGGRLEAHAWVESEGRIVIGGVGDLLRYNPLPPVE